MRNRKNRKSCLLNKGFARREIIMCSSLFALFSGGVLSAAVLIKGLNVEAARANAARQIAQSILRQLEGIDQRQLIAARDDESRLIALPLVDVSGKKLTDDFGGEINNGDWCHRLLSSVETKLRQSGDSPLVFRFRPVLERPGSASANGAEAVHIVLHYELSGQLFPPVNGSLIQSLNLVAKY